MYRAFTLQRMAGAAFFLAVFIYCIFPVEATSDFWWHLSSGRLIMQGGALPDQDPFAFTSMQVDDRGRLILRGYWLAQVAYYLVYSVAGLWGISLLHAASTTLMLYLIYRTARLAGLIQPIAMLLCAPALLFFYYHAEPRPQVLSFMLFSVVIFILERWRSMGFRGRAIWLLPPVATLWANVHPGYIIIYAVLLAYTAAFVLRALVKKDRAGLGTLLTVSALSIAFSALNPMGVEAVVVALRSLAEARRSEVLEYYSPWRAAMFSGMNFLYILVVQLALTVTVLALSARKVRLEHALLILGITVMALSASRFAMFFAIAASMIMVPYIKVEMPRLAQRAAWVIAAALMVHCFAIEYSKGPVRGGIFKAGPVSPRAVEFIARAKLPPNLFNAYEWGGYIKWRLWPAYKVYIDSRMLFFDNYYRYSMGVVDNDYEREFDQFGINTAVLNHFDPIDYRFRPILFNLLEDEKWEIVYYDNKSVIFVRKTEAPRGLPFECTSVYLEYMGQELVKWKNNRPSDPRPYLLTAQIEIFLGKKEQAAAEIGQVLKFSPDNSRARQMLHEL